MDHFRARVASRNRGSGAGRSSESAQSAHARSSDVAGSRGAIPSDAARRAETADRNRRRQMGSEIRKTKRAMTAEEKRKNEEMWANIISKERLGSKTLIEEYQKQGAGYIEVNGVPMIHYLIMFDGTKRHFNITPSTTPFTVSVGIRIWREAKTPGAQSYWDPMFVKVCPEDAPAYEQGMAHGEAMQKIYEQMDAMSYTWWRFADVSVDSMINRQFVDMNWAPVAFADRPLRAGLPVIDDSLAAGQPEHCVPAAFDENADGECFAGQLYQLLDARAKKRARPGNAATARYKIDDRTEEERRCHFSGRDVYATRASIIRKLNELCPNRNAADGLPGGMTVRDIDTVCKDQRLYLIVLDIYDVVQFVADHRTETQKKQHTYRRTCIFVAGHGHIYMLADNDEATHVVKTLRRIPDERKVGAYIKRSAAESAKHNWSTEQNRRMVDERPIVRIDDSEPLPPFEELKPVIYHLGHQRVFQLYQHYMSTVGRIPDRRMVRRDGRAIREFTIYLDGRGRSEMCTFFSSGSQYRGDMYVRLCEGTVRSVYTDDRFADTPPGHFVIMYLSDGPGKVVHDVTQAVLGVRRMPTSETKQRVLIKQSNRCKLCSDEFTTSEFVRDGDNRLSEEDDEWECRPCWEHMRPHADGGRDVSENNIAAVCLRCMLEKNGRERSAGGYRGVDQEYTSAYNPTARKEFYRYTGDRKNKLLNENCVRAKIPLITRDVPEGHLYIGIDMTKSRRFWLCGEDAVLGWPVYGVNSEILPFDGDPDKLGKYYVRSSDWDLLHGDGWYPHAAVMCALAYGIIQLSDIKLMFRPTSVLPRNYFEKIMREIQKHIAAAKEELIAKGADPAEVTETAKTMYKDFLGNVIVGLTGKSKKVEHKETIELDFYAAMEKADMYDVYAVSHFVMECNDRDCYRVNKVITVALDHCRRNIYDDVLWFERVNTFKLSRAVEAAGGSLMFEKTDEVGFSIPPEKWDARKWEQMTYKHVGAWNDTGPNRHPGTGRPYRYRITYTPKGLQHQNYHQLCRQGRPDSDLPRIIPQWKTSAKDLTNPFTLADPNYVLPPPPPYDPHRLPEKVGKLTHAETRALGLRIVDSGKSLFITGEGGSGKTFFQINGLVWALRERKIRYQLATPTCATREALRGYEHCEGAVTMQKLSQAFTKKSSKALIEYTLGIRDVDAPFYLIMDEVSMYDDGMWRMLSVLSHRVPGLRVIFLGDFRQLPPVADPYLMQQEHCATGVETYEDSPVFRDLCDGNRIVLTHNHRLAPGEGRLRAAARAVRDGEEIDVSEFAVTDHNTLVNICYTNAKVREVNLARDSWFLSQHPEHKPVFVPRSKRKRMKSMDLHLIPGTRLVGIGNGGSTCNEVWNKERYIVTAVDEAAITLETYECEHRRTITVKTENASKILSLGWAFTYYHVQGATMRDRFTVYDWHHFFASPRARYVVLTRAVHGWQVQIDASDKNTDTLHPPPEMLHAPPDDEPDTLLPSECNDRMEFIDTAAWNELSKRVSESLSPHANPAGFAYFKRIMEGVRSRISPDDARAAELYINTTYKITTGRRTAYMTSGKGMPIQNMAGPIRTLLLSRRGHDLDIRNAHPTLLVQYLKKHADQGAPPTPFLFEYVAERDSVHARILAELHAAGISSARLHHIKRGAVRTMFLGKLGGWFASELGVPASTDPEEVCPSLMRLREDYERAAAFLVELNPQALVNATERHTRTGKPHRNHLAGAVSQIMCEIETDVVAAIENCFVRECGLCVRALIYDGLVVHRYDPADDSIDPAFLRLAERRAMEMTGYQIELVEKELFGKGDVDAALAFLRDLQSDEP